MGVVMMLLPVTAIGHITTLCVPELFTAQDLMIGLYKAAAYYELLEFTMLQFGGMTSMFRDDKSGTLQQHSPAKIWNQAPFCCFWCVCAKSSCWKEHIMGWKEGRVVFYLTLQFCVLQPVMSCLKLIVYYEGVSVSALEHVSLYANVVAVASLFTCIYANAVMNAVAESCPPTHEQQRLKYIDEAFAVESKELPPVKNLSAKALFVTILTAPSAICYVITSQIVQDSCVDGHLLTSLDRTAFISSFVSIIFCLLGALWGFKAFPLKASDAVIAEYHAGLEISAEIYPASMLRRLISVYGCVIERRL